MTTKLVQIGEFKKGLPGTSIKIDKVSVFEVPAEFDVEALFNALTTAQKNDRESANLLGGQYIEDMGIRIECKEFFRQSYVSRKNLDLVLQRLDSVKVSTSSFERTLTVETLHKSGLTLQSEEFVLRKDYDVEKLYGMLVHAQHSANEAAKWDGLPHCNETNIRIIFGDFVKEIQLSNSNKDTLVRYLEGSKIA